MAGATPTDLLTAVKSATSSNAKGVALENLLCSLFELVPGVATTGRNSKNVFGTEEIDITFWNDQLPGGCPFLPTVILVECKNWSDRLGAEQVSWFDTKVDNRGSDFGILIAAHGITGDPDDLTASHKVIADALAKKRRIVVITLSELEAALTVDAFILLIKKKLCDLVLYGTTVQGTT